MRKLRFLVVVVMVLFVFASPLLGGERLVKEKYLEQWDTILEAAREYGVSPLLLWAVIGVESNFASPYVIGIDRNPGLWNALKEASRVAGFTVKRMSPSRVAIFPRSRVDGVKVIRVLEARGFTFDVGLGQVNNRTAKSFGLNPADLLDMRRNIAFTAFYLKRVIVRHGSQHVWRYNGSRSYRRKLQAKLAAVSNYNRWE